LKARTYAVTGRIARITLDRLAHDNGATRQIAEGYAFQQCVMQGGFKQTVLERD